MTGSSSQSSAHSQHAVLLVEDDEGTREFLEMALSPTFAIDVAATAADALDIVRQGKVMYDLFLLDISLRPGPGGVAVLKALRAMEDYRATPAVAITAYHPDAAPERFMDAGFDGYLRKPFYQEDLLDLIDELLAPDVR